MATLNPETTNKNILLEEWKECRASIARFDEMLLNIRKYGFSFITILLSVDGYLLAQKSLGSLEVMGIYYALSVLIIALFRIDRYHAMFLRGAVFRARLIEKELGMDLTGDISRMCLETHTSASTMGNWIYVLFCLANAFILFGSLSKVYMINPQNAILFIIFFVLPFLTIIYVYHARTQQNRRGKPGK